MQINFAPELEAFRAEVAQFFATAPTPAIREAGRKTTSVFAPFKLLPVFRLSKNAIENWSVFFFLI